MKLGRKLSGGRYVARRKTKKYERPGIARDIRVKERKSKVLRTRGGADKEVLLSCDIANIIGADKKAKVAKITNVIETSANRFWARQNRLVKGAIIETDLGKARITNRPSQEGIINAVLIKE